MWEYYDNRSILVTGGSGFLGTAIVHRLLTTTSVSRIYLVCRGGTEKLLSKWKEWLPDSTVDELHCPNRLVVLDGDILLPNVGLSQSELDVTRRDVSVIIHGASSINLGSRTSGCVHAVSGVRSRLKFASWLQSLQKLRQIPWEIQTTWTKGDWKSTDQHAISQLYAIGGASFAFSEDKTIEMCDNLTEKERQGMQLWTQISTIHHLLNHAAGIRYAMDEFSRRSWMAWLITSLFYSDFGKTSMAPHLSNMYEP
ncbi:hypothetical protein N7493_001346 [Penicillium malachiteum]|uniref:Fatty acyl-CoA reductase n=1 Tax=Penicillium malachiteum TaxID=1324776 RepID=A0AAD6HUA1_9EURO|nr:hypothetical protein N7493_001346 [Penicillium malachiteum]